MSQALFIGGLQALCLIAMAWGAAALWYRLLLPQPWRKAVLVGWLLLALLLVVLNLQGMRLALLGQALLVAGLLIWWFRLRPTHDRPWADDVVHLATGEVRQGELILPHVRNFRWHTRDDADVAWEKRRYELAKLDSVDLIVSSWGRPGVAHVMVSFGFEGADFVVFSVEVRRLSGERFSEIGGFFRQYEIAIIAADERDAVGLRTHVRGERVSLFRLRMPRSAMRSLLLAYVEEANDLAASPRFYNTLTANCTTLIFAMARGIGARLPFDYRLLVTGRLPGYVYKVGGLWPGFSLPELMRRGRVDERARQAERDLHFSQRIRHDVPGWNDDRRA
ncbi:Lnb N-terminal periplasmic domain-containing protein [Halomonas sp. E14]|uniref:Lnb N-terminal periplasmic domain-containing protein n=1 Tax=Halomonas sp. E14 TaxID=3397245 RepID=UPI00403E418A